MNKAYSVCENCVDKYCCRGLCKEMNEYLIDRMENIHKKSFKTNDKSGTIKQRK